MSVAIAWFRRDLRLDDNPALWAAMRAADQVVPLFVRDPDLARSAGAAGRRIERLDAALVALDRELRARGGRLVVRSGRPEQAVPAIVHETGAVAVHAHRDYGPYAARRDARVGAALAALPAPLAARSATPAAGTPGVALVLHPGTLLVEPERLGDRQVFAPFHRAWLAALPSDSALEAPTRIHVPDGAWSEPLPGVEPRGEPAAWALLAGFATRAGGYAGERNRLDLDATSRLSSDLHFGTISPRRVAAAIPDEAFLRQLAWRDWAAHLLYRRPEAAADAWQARFRGMPWNDDERLLGAWRDGVTGYPAVDAAMRQLGAEGFIANRARMIAASFLSRDLLLDWRLGVDHFARTLVDADVANNVMGWQWTAGVGTDAAPWPRVMNPVLQGERFDPHGEWVRRWVPELRRVPDAFVHRPWDAPGGVPRGYAARIVDHGEARRRSLAGFGAWVGTSARGPVRSPDDRRYHPRISAAAFSPDAAPATSAGSAAAADDARRHGAR